MKDFQIGVLVVFSALIMACGTDNTAEDSKPAEKAPSILSDTHQQALKSAKGVGEVLADDEKRTKDKMKELGL